MPKEQPLLKIKLSGPGIKPGRIAIPVLLRVCEEAQAAVNRQAEALEAMRTDRPATEQVLRECTLELIALRKGSTTLDFARANKQESFLPELSLVGVEAVTAVAATLRAVGKKRGPKWIPPDPKVLDSLDRLGSLFDEGIGRVQWISPRANGRKAASAEFVPATLKRLRQRKQESLSLTTERPASPLNVAGTEGVSDGMGPETAIQESFLEGLLEPGEGKVRIIPPIGAPAVVTYGAEQSENVLEALHKPVRVKVDPKGRKLVDIEITQADTLGSSFFQHRSIDQLRAEQGVPAVTDLEALAGLIPEEDLEEFVADIYRDRG